MPKTLFIDITLRKFVSILYLLHEVSIEINDRNQLAFGVTLCEAENFLVPLIIIRIQFFF